MAVVLAVLGRDVLAVVGRDPGWDRGLTAHEPGV
jgi:hypothetical protein